MHLYFDLQIFRLDLRKKQEDGKIRNGVGK